MAETKTYTDFEGVVHTFEEDKETDLHRHTLDGGEVISVTTLLAEQNISKKFSDNPVAVENRIKASEKGTLIHKQIEGTLPLMSDEAVWARKLIKSKYIDYSQEVLVHYKNIYCGIVDFVGFDKATGELHIIDWKTGNFDKEVVLWQITLYYFALMMMKLIPKDVTVRFFVGDLKSEDCRLVELFDRISEQEFQRLLECHQNFNGEGSKTYEKPFVALSGECYSHATDKSVYGVFLAQIQNMTPDEAFVELAKMVSPSVKYAFVKAATSEAKKLEEAIKNQLSESDVTVAKLDGLTWELSVDYNVQSVDKEIRDAYLQKHAKKTWDKAVEKATIYQDKKTLRYKGSNLFNKTNIKKITGNNNER